MYKAYRLHLVFCCVLSVLVVLCTSGFASPAWGADATALSPSAGQNSSPTVSTPSSAAPVSSAPDDNQNSTGTSPIAASADSTNTAQPTNPVASAAPSILPQVSTGRTIADGLYRISYSLDTSKTLDVRWGSLDNGGNIQIYQSNGTDAQIFRITYVDEGSGNGYYTVINLNSGKALDVTGASTSDGANVQQYESNYTDAQLWAIQQNQDGSYTLVNKGSGKALDVAGASTVDGSNVQQWTCNNTGAQKFIFVSSPVLANGIYSISSCLASSMVLDVSYGCLSDGIGIQLYTSNSTNSQKYSIASNGNGYYTIESIQSNKVLDVTNGSSWNCARIQQYTANGTDAQLWKIISNADGTYSFMNKGSGRVIDIANGNAADGACVQQYDSNGTAAQKFTLSKTSASNTLADGLYTVASSLDYNAVLDITCGLTSDCTYAQLYSFNASRAQKYYFTAQGNGYYSVRNIKSGKYLDAEDAGVVNGTRVWQYSYNGSDAQLWRVSSVAGHISLINKNSGLCLDLANGCVSDGTVVQTYQANDTAAQQFDATLLRIPSEGYYTIVSALDENKVIDVANASREDCANIQLWTANSTLAQAFRLVDQGNGYYCLYNINSGRVVDVSNGNVSDGTNVQQYGFNGTDAQLWKIVGTDDGYYHLVNKGSGTYLDVSGNASSDGANIQIYSATGGLGQEFGFSTMPVSQSGYSPYQTGVSLDTAIRAQMAVNSNFSYSQFESQMNPNTLTEGSGLYQFLCIDRGYSGLTADQINDYIDSTFKGRTGILHGLGQYFVDASKLSGVNEAYLVAHAIWETGWGTSKLSAGIMRGSNTYYNFFGIGAFDNDAVASGSSYAVLSGWTSPMKAIEGGASWIARNYTYGDYAQNTVYKMRFNVVDGTATHQYATDFAWANGISSLISELYAYGDTAPALAYEVPVYS